MATVADYLDEIEAEKRSSKTGERKSPQLKPATESRSVSDWLDEITPPKKNKKPETGSALWSPKEKEAPDRNQERAVIYAQELSEIKAKLSDPKLTGTDRQREEANLKAVEREISNLPAQYQKTALSTTFIKDEALETIAPAAVKQIATKNLRAAPDLEVPTSAAMEAERQRGQQARAATAKEIQEASALQKYGAPLLEVPLAVTTALPGLVYQQATGKYGGYEPRSPVSREIIGGLGEALEASKLEGLTGAPILRRGAKVTTPKLAEAAIELGGKAAQATKSVASVPVKIGTGIGNVVASTFGLTSGVGADTVKEAFKAGLYRRPEFWQNLTGKADKTQVLQDAKDALQLMREDRLGNYSTNTKEIFDNKTPLKFDKVDKALNNFLDSITVKTQKGEYLKIGKDQLAKIDELKDVIKTWKDDPELHTAAGLDALKRRIDAIYPDSPKHTQVQRAVTQTRNAAKMTILDANPKYAEIMKAYEDGISLEKEIERTLSLGPKANPETALRKLQALGRNNVQTSYGYRGDLVRQLEEATGKNLTAALAGQSMSTLTPRSLAAQGGGLATLGAAAQLGPEALALLPLQSPALVGGSAYGLGKALSPVQQGFTKISELKDALKAINRAK